MKELIVKRNFTTHVVQLRTSFEIKEKKLNQKFVLLIKKRAYFLKIFIIFLNCMISLAQVGIVVDKFMNTSHLLLKQSKEKMKPRKQNHKTLFSHPTDGSQEKRDLKKWF